MPRLLWLFILCLSIACQSKNDYDRSDRFYKDVYLPLLEKNTRADRRYDGFYNRFEYHVTLLNRQLLKARTELRGRYYHWHEFRRETEKTEALAEAEKQTSFFISFFSPDKPIEELDADDPAWAIYLEVAGRRYRGRVVEQKDILELMKKYYPYHNRWSQAFELQFQVPTAKVERREGRLLITGPLGKSLTVFPPSSAEFQ